MKNKDTLLLIQLNNAKEEYLTLHKHLAPENNSMVNLVILDLIKYRLKELEVKINILDEELQDI